LCQIRLGFILCKSIGSFAVIAMSSVAGYLPERWKIGSEGKDKDKVKILIVK